MTTIWKFPIQLAARVAVPMPMGAKVLTAAGQGRDICIWAEVEPTRDREARLFAVYGTGHQMPDDPGTYIGTAMLAGGHLVFHVYEEPAS